MSGEGEGETLYIPIRAIGIAAADTSAYCSHFAMLFRKKNEETSFAKLYPTFKNASFEYIESSYFWPLIYKLASGVLIISPSLTHIHPLFHIAYLVGNLSELPASPK